MKKRKPRGLVKKGMLFVCTVAVLVSAAGVVGIRMRFPVLYLDYVRTYAGELDPSWVMAVIMAESGFRPTAVSPVGARGLMQLMPDTAQDVARRMGRRNFTPEDLWNPAVNIAMGCFYLNERLRDFDGDIRLALAAYNGGPTKVKQAIEKTVRDPIKQRSFWYLYRTRALPDETRQYVPKVIAAMIIGRDPPHFGFDSEQVLRKSARD